MKETCVCTSYSYIFDFVVTKQKGWLFSNQFQCDSRYHSKSPFDGLMVFLEMMQEIPLFTKSSVILHIIYSSVQRSLQIKDILGHGIL